MSDKFEKQKVSEYVANLLSNNSYIDDNFKSIKEWLFDKDNIYGQLNFPAKDASSAEEEFTKLAKNNRLQAYSLIKQYAKNLANNHKKYTPSIFEKNLIYLQELFGLKEYEKELLGLLIRYDRQESFYDTLKNISNSNICDTHNKAIALGISADKVYSAFHKNSTLEQLGLIDFEYDGDIDSTHLLKILFSHKFKDKQALKSYFMGKPLKATLQWDDFRHIPQISILEKITQSAVKRHQKGVNILLYGEPGTGKTELAKTLGQRLECSLYSIGEQQGDIEDNDDNRYDKLLRAQKLLQKDKNVLLLVDEADDLLYKQGGFFCRDDDFNKIQINRLLENNEHPTIWISNNISRMDKAYLRRFTYAIKFEKHKQSVRVQMWQKCLNANKLPADEQTAKSFAEKYSLSPSFIVSAVKSAKLINGGLPEIKQTLDVLQEAYNNGYKPRENINKEKIAFNPNLLNTDLDLVKLAQRIKDMKKLDFSMCLYGVPGTGKSAYAQYLGELLDLPVIKKKCSDLIDMYVGGTEKNIAQAFEEAADQSAILIFDEADSFLQDRSNAVRNWEVTQVNEMLTQMEKHKFPFVCTTNLMEKLDKASLRRFTFKVQYNYLSKQQRTQCFEHFFGFQNVNLNDLSSLTPGDFKVVYNKAEMMDCLNDKNKLLEMLEQELKNKAPVARHIGFL